MKNLAKHKILFMNNKQFLNKPKYKLNNLIYAG